VPELWTRRSGFKRDEVVGDAPPRQEQRNRRRYSSTPFMKFHCLVVHLIVAAQVMPVVFDAPFFSAVPTIFGLEGDLPVHTDTAGPIPIVTRRGMTPPQWAAEQDVVDGCAAVCTPVGAGASGVGSSTTEYPRSRGSGLRTTPVERAGLEKPEPTWIRSTPRKSLSLHDIVQQAQPFIPAASGSLNAGAKTLPPALEAGRGDFIHQVRINRHEHPLAAYCS